MIEQERRDRELALRLTQDPDALDAEVQQAPQLPLQRWAEDTFLKAAFPISWKHSPPDVTSPWAVILTSV